MDSNSTKLCRLCLQTNDDLVNIFEKCQDSTIASIMSKHFWFQVYKNDGLPEWICQICWIHTKTFHTFLKRIEFRHRNDCRSFDLVSVDSIKQEPNVSPIKEEMEPDLNIVKCEETELILEMVDKQMSKENSLDFNYDKSENSYTSTKLCRLCLQTSDDSVNIFEKCQDSTIASILSKHFWFQVYKNDGLPEWICQICWIHTKTFHTFYKRIEFRHRNDCRSFDLVSVNLINQEGNVSSIKEGMESVLNIVKCEETELILEMVDKQMTKQSGENSYTSDDENQPNKTSKNDYVGHSRVSKIQPNIERKSYNSHSRSEKEEQDAQIREFFAMKCDICSDVEFETLMVARKHYRSVHNIRGYLMCCGNKYPRRYQILAHIRYHINPDEFRCDPCGKNFHDKKALDSHINNHVPLNLRAYKCNLCSSSFTKSTALKSHVKNQHSSTNGEMFPCDKCSKSFRSSLLLRCHIRNVHEFSLEHVCEVCARRFKTNQLLVNHTASEHSINTQPKAQCNICGVWMKHATSLRKHLARHEIRKGDPVNCPICKKLVKHEGSLSRHIQYTHGGRHHPCTVCEKAFKNAKSLKEHIAIHTGEDLYNCPYCDKKFKSNANMYSHRKKAHSVEWTRDKPKGIKLENKSTE